MKGETLLFLPLVTVREEPVAYMTTLSHDPRTQYIVHDARCLAVSVTICADMQRELAIVWLQNSGNHRALPTISTIRQNEHVFQNTADHRYTAGVGGQF
jgi:hypothetical protein